MYNSTISEKIAILHFLVLRTCHSEMESEPNVVISAEKVMLCLKFGKKGKIRRKMNASNELTLFAAFPAKYHCHLSLSRTKIRNVKAHCFSES